MTRGTTPTIKIKLINCDVSILQSAYVTFKQFDKELTKTGDDIEIDYIENMIIVRLSQEDTLLFYPMDVEVQVRAVLTDGNAIASKVQKMPMHRVLKNEVIL